MITVGANQKRAHQSKTVVGAALALASSLLMLWGGDLGMGPETTAKALQTVTALGVFLAVFGLRDAA